MSTEVVGKGRCKDVNYTYKCTSKDWFGTFECKVNKSFLEFLSISELWTEKFRIAGFDWQMYLVCGKDGKLGAYLCSCSRSLFFPAPVAHFSITLVNTNKQNSKSWGSIRRFPSGKRQGKADLASISDFKNEDSGFLHWEDFVIRIEVRIKKEENEVCYVAVENNTVTFVWKIKNLCSASPLIMTTEVMKLDEYEWSLIIYRNELSGNEGHLSFFLISHKNSVAAEVTCVAKHQSSEKNLVKKTNLDRKAEVCGLPECMGIVSLGDEELGFVKDGWTTLSTKIAVRDQEVPKDTSESALEENQDAISNTGEPQASGSYPMDTMPDPPEVASSVSDSNFSQTPRNGKEPMEGPIDTKGSFEAPDGFLGSATSPGETHSACKMEQIGKAVLTLNEGMSVIVKDAQIGYADLEISSQQSSVEQGGPPIEILPANVDRVNPCMDYSLERLSTLTEGSIFDQRFLIEPGRIQGKPHVLFAVDRISNEKVVLKFYLSRTAFENSKKLHPKLSAEFVCKMLLVIDSKDGYPPCLVFERGNSTLDEWIQEARRDPMTPKTALFQILICISHLHSQGVIHCDIKPSNVAFFLPKHAWKLLDTDSSVEMGEACPIRSSLMYAAPEVIQASDDGETTIIPKESIDMWAFGILAYEVLTGTRYYGIDATPATVKDCLFGGKGLPSLELVEERQAKTLLRGLLSFSPENRPSAHKTIDHALFRMPDVTTPGVAGFRQVGQCVVHDAVVIPGRKYEMRIRNLCNLKTEDEVESKTFDAGGKKWKLGLLICKHNNGLYEIMKIVLISCNDKGVSASVKLTVELNGNQISEAVSEPDSKLADAFDIIARCDIEDHVADLRQCSPEDEVVVTVDLTNVGDATEEDLYGGRTEQTISLEVITSDSIKTWLNRHKAFGLTSTDREKHLDICGRSLVRCWATIVPDRRFWQCKRDKHGHIVAERCLNEAKMLERFEDICTKDDGGRPWVTVFEERKLNVRRLAPVDEDSMIVFCKLFEPPFRDLSFLGHLIVQKKEPCPKMLSRIAYDMARLPDGKEYSAFVERRGQQIEDITKVLTPLHEYEETVSHVLILRAKDSNESDLSVAAIQENLHAIHNRDLAAGRD